MSPVFPAADDSPPAADPPGAPASTPPSAPAPPDPPAAPPTPTAEKKGEPTQAQPAVSGVIPLVTPVSPETPGPEADPSLGAVLPPVQEVDPLAPSLEAPPESTAEKPTGATSAAEGETPASDPADENVPDDTLAALARRTAIGGVLAQFSEMAGFDTLGLVGRPLGGKGLSIAASIATAYDTNPSRGYDTGYNGGDWLTTAALGTSYQSPSNAAWTYGGQYDGGYTWYWKNSDSNTPFHRASATLNYGGAKLSASFDASLAYSTGANRDYGALVDQLSWGCGAGARYSISPKTSLEARLGYNLTTDSGTVSDNRQSVLAGCSAIWHYSPLTEFGAGLRYSYQTGSGDDDRSGIGPSIQANYQLSKIVSFHSRVGLEFSTYGGGGGNDISYNTTIGLTYRPSALWALAFDLRHDTQAQPGSAGFYQKLTGIHLGYERRLGRFNLSTGASYELCAFDSPSGLAAAPDDRNYFTVDASLGHPLLADRFYANVFVRYSVQSGGNFNSWNSMLTGVGLSHSF